MECGCRMLYGYTQSDEISLLFHRDDNSFSRKLRKLNSILAGDASAKVSVLLGDTAAFDCRICQLPTPELVRDYFRWRQEDAARNALNAHCYWMLRKSGQDERTATSEIKGLSVAAKNELLFQNGINFNDLPAWQKRGAGLFVEDYEKQGVNPKTGELTVAMRRRIREESELPMGPDYGTRILSIVKASIDVTA
jgi:tRNA(His) 5'-end guanylyltransferase